MGAAQKGRTGTRPEAPYRRAGRPPLPALCCSYVGGRRSASDPQAYGCEDLWDRLYVLTIDLSAVLG